LTSRSEPTLDLTSVCAQQYIVLVFVTDSDSAMNRAELDPNAVNWEQRGSLPTISPTAFLSTTVPFHYMAPLVFVRLHVQGISEHSRRTGENATLTAENGGRTDLSRALDRV
jgi:hypothetical protein